MLIFWPITVDSAPPGRLWRGSQTPSSQGLSNQHYDFSSEWLFKCQLIWISKKKKKNLTKIRWFEANCHYEGKQRTVCVLLSRKTRGLDLWISHLHINKENHKLHWYQSHNIRNWGLSIPNYIIKGRRLFYSGCYLLRYASLQNSSVHPPLG